MLIKSTPYQSQRFMLFLKCYLKKYISKYKTRCVSNSLSNYILMCGSNILYSKEFT